ncbi:hypothetical protein ACFOOP_14180 [Marinicaulis aureus]|uniref:Uncharacterized protein n=1 Tax=Hyphococcus aureus TaxID=2666033 RepID=A0ABW1KZN1_9PROT
MPNTTSEFSDSFMMPESELKLVLVDFFDRDAFQLRSLAIDNAMMRRQKATEAADRLMSKLNQRRLAFDTN